MDDLYRNQRSEQHLRLDIDLFKCCPIHRFSKIDQTILRFGYVYIYIYIYIFFQRNDIIHALCEINLKKKTFKQIQQNHNRTTSITLSQARRFLTKWTKQSTKWIILMKNISWSTRKKTIRLRKIYDTNLSSQRNSNLNITIDGLQNFRI